MFFILIMNHENLQTETAADTHTGSCQKKKGTLIQE